MCLRKALIYISYHGQYDHICELDNYVRAALKQT